MAARFQPTILEPVPPVASVLVFDLEPAADPRAGLEALRTLPARSRSVVGIGQPLALALDAKVNGLRGFCAMSGIGVSFPSNQGALFVSIGGNEHGEVLDLALEVRRNLSGFRLLEEVDTFRYRGGRDLTGYEDGTENPKDELAIAAAIIKDGDGLAGGSFVAVQRYVHDLDVFGKLEAAARDAVIGRSFETNEEIPDAVASAHVKRSAQESFDPPAFMVRRSMPWGSVSEHGLYFVAYVNELAKFERVLQRMAGLEDGVVDGLLSFTRAVSGGFYFCPPMKGDELDLTALGI
jgi:putative iron-dependent peroxidase